MKKASSARRVPRKIGQDDDDEGSTTSSSAAQEPVIRRPTTKPRKSSSLRNSLGPSAVDEDEDSEASVVIPKRSNISRVAIQRNAAKRSSLLNSPLPVRHDEDEDERPDYSAAALQQLKDSTPSTPRDFGSATQTDVEEVSSGTQALDLSSKFGSSLSRYEQPSAIPSATEIAEKKARRARLAKEQQAEEFISLDPDDPEIDDDDNVMRDEIGRLVLKPKDKYGMSESRLVADDEDIMENFDDFTEDGKVSLGRKAEVEAARKRKQDMATQIAEAEGATDSDSDDSERERNTAFEAAQTKHGTYGQNTTLSDPADARPKTPPIITPLPTLDGVIERLRSQLSEMQSSRMQKLREMENLQKESVRLAEEEIRVQRALKETADKFEQIREGKGISGVKKEGTPAVDVPLGTGLQITNGKHETISAADAAPEEAMDEDAEDEDEEGAQQNAGFAGLGFDTARRGLGAALGFGPTRDPDESDGAS